MLIHVKKNKGYSERLLGLASLAFALLLPLQAAFAQDDAPAPDATAATKPAASAIIPPAAPSANSTEIDSSTSTALDYLFNHKAGEGTTMKAGNEVASAFADKVKAVDVLKTPGLDNPIIRARFETYLSLKEVPDDRIKEYFGKISQVSETLKAGDNFGAWKILYSLSEYKDLDAGISRELANRVESIWNSSRAQNGLGNIFQALPLSTQGRVTTSAGRRDRLERRFVEPRFHHGAILIFDEAAALLGRDGNEVAGRSADAQCKHL